MKTVVIHIGQSKTGTTTTQRFFWGRRDSLESHRIHYLRAGVTTPRYPAHYKLFPRDTAQDIIGLEQAWSAAINEIDSSPSALFIISCEGAWLRDRSFVQYVRNILNKYAVFIVFVLREPRSYLVSSYKQGIKTGKHCSSFREFLRKAEGRLDYRAILDCWAEQFGRSNVGCFSYECIKGELLPNFLAALGLDYDTLSRLPSCMTEESCANVTPSDTALYGIMLACRFERYFPRFGRAVRRRVAQLLITDQASRAGDLLARLPLRLISDDDLQALQAFPKGCGIEFDDIEAYSERIKKLVES